MLPKCVPKGVQKWTLKKTRNLHFYVFFLASFLVSWASLVALCCSLVASWPPGSKEGAQEQRQGGQEPPKSRPGEAKRGPREPKGEPKVFRRARERPKREHQSVQESQGETQERPRERQRVPRQAQERPSDKHKLMSFPSVTRIHLLDIFCCFSVSVYL